MDERQVFVEHVNGDAHWSTKPNLARFAESSPKQCHQERSMVQTIFAARKSACLRVSATSLLI